MSPRAPLGLSSQRLLDDERLLSRGERELLSSVLRHASSIAQNSPVKAAILEIIERAVGETVAQRSYGLLGNIIVRQLIEQDASGSLSGFTVPEIRTADLGARTSWLPQPPAPKQPQTPGFEEPGARISPFGQRPPSPGPETPGFEEPVARVSSNPRPPSPQPESPGFEEPTARTFPRPPKEPETPGFDEPMAKASWNSRPPSQPEHPGFEEPVAKASWNPRPPSQPEHPGFEEPVARVSPLGPRPSSDPQSPGFDDPGAEREGRQTSVAILDPPKVDFLPAQCLVLDEFLTPEELQALTRYALANENEFRVSEVVSAGAEKGNVDFEHRRSRVLCKLGEHRDVILDRIQASLPRILDKLNLNPFETSRIEAQMTASNDGDFFRQHSDSGQGKVASRELTFVYFFHREPRAFSGGELRIYDSVWARTHYVADKNCRVVRPEQNQMVLFPSCLVHEITSVECPSRAFADSRFTVNGWFRR